jgi:hypothetical protein
MKSEFFWGLLLVVSGAIILYRGLNKDDQSMPGIKYRMLVVGGAAIFFGLIIMFR